MSHKKNMEQKEALAIFDGKDPWSKTQKIRGENIAHQIDIEIDTVPVAVPVALVVFQNGRLGDEPLYDVGCAYVAEGYYREAVKTLGTPKLDVAIAVAVRLAANHQRVMDLFSPTL